MPYKLIGTALVVLSALAYSDQRGKGEKARIASLKTLLRFFEDCLLGVSNYSLTLSEIVNGFEATSEGWSELLKKIKAKGLSSSVEEAKKVLVGKEELEIYSDFALRFGRGFIKDSECVCNECAQKLRELISELDTKAKKDSRARFAISLCVSLMTCLLFL